MAFIMCYQNLPFYILCSFILIFSCPGFYSRRIDLDDYLPSSEDTGFHSFDESYLEREPYTTKNFKDDDEDNFNNNLHIRPVEVNVPCSRRLRQTCPTLQVISDELNRNCGKYSNFSSYISSGRKAREGEFPPYVLVIVVNGYRDGKAVIATCGGTILSPTLVLTAAHCTDHGVVEAYVRTGLRNPKPIFLSSSNIAVKETCVSKTYKFREALGHDIAILKLAEPIEFNETVSNACLPNEPFDYYTQAYTVGMGITNAYPEEFAEYLQVLPVKKHSCVFGTNITPPPYEICFKSNQDAQKGDSCKGDSGGPILAIQNNKLTLVGVTSWGFGPCKAGVNDPSVNVDPYYLRNEILTLASACYGG